MKEQNMIYVVKSKITKSGHTVNVCGSNPGQYFANGKQYWIEYGRPSGRRSINRSDSLSYITKKFEEIK